MRVRDPQPDPPPLAEHLPLVSARGPSCHKAEMKATYGVARLTARAAINALRAEGIMVIIRSKGS